MISPRVVLSTADDEPINSFSSSYFSFCIHATSTTIWFVVVDDDDIISCWLGLLLLPRMNRILLLLLLRRRFSSSHSRHYCYYYVHVQFLSPNTSNRKRHWQIRFVIVISGGLCCIEYSTSSPSFLRPHIWLCHRYCTAILCCSFTQVNYIGYDSFYIISVPIPVLFLLLIWDCLMMMYILFVAFFRRRTSVCCSYYYNYYYCYYYYFVIDCSYSISPSCLVSFHVCCYCCVPVRWIPFFCSWSRSRSKNLLLLLLLLLRWFVAIVVEFEVWTESSPPSLHRFLPPTVPRHVHKITPMY